MRVVGLVVIVELDQQEEDLLLEEYQQMKNVIMYKMKKVKDQVHLIVMK